MDHNRLRDELMHWTIEYETALKKYKQAKIKYIPIDKSKKIRLAKIEESITAKTKAEKERLAYLTDEWKDFVKSEIRAEIDVLNAQVDRDIAKGWIDNLTMQISSLNAEMRNLNGIS